MKKPLNKVALAIWVMAVLLALLNFSEAWNAYQGMRDLRQQAGEGYIVWAGVIRAIANIITQFAFLGGLGMLIEIADRILWHIQKQI
jgi:hypothetical protein